MGHTLASSGSPPLALGTHHPPLEEAWRQDGLGRKQSWSFSGHVSLTLVSVHTAEARYCEGWKPSGRPEMWLLVIPLSPLVITPFT